MNKKIMYYSLETLKQIKSKIDQTICSQVLMNNPFGQCPCFQLQWTYSRIWSGRILFGDKFPELNIGERKKNGLKNVIFPHYVFITRRGIEKTFIALYYTTRKTN